jgi:hypothetical protein
VGAVRSVFSYSCRLFLLLLTRKVPRGPRRDSRANASMTIPAIAPPDRPELTLFLGSVPPLSLPDPDLVPVLVPDDLYSQRQTDFLLCNFLQDLLVALDLEAEVTGWICRRSRSCMRRMLGIVLRHGRTHRQTWRRKVEERTGGDGLGYGSGLFFAV